MNNDYPALTQALLPLAHQAGQAIIAVYHSEFAVEHKADQSPLTEADRASHDCIVAGLQALTPKVPVLSEESKQLPFATRSLWSTYWLVDPLDGTKEFIKRNGEFTVNIALIHEQVPVIGVVYVPVSEVYYYAAQGLGAWKQAPGHAAMPIQTRVCPAPQQMVIAGSRSHGGDSLQAFMRCLGDGVRMNSMGSSLKMCLVAEGLADVYPRFGPTSEWDTAAAQCVVEQAGGQLTDTHFQRLRYNTKESLLNPHFIAFGQALPSWTHCLDC